MNVLQHCVRQKTCRNPGTQACSLRMAGGSVENSSASTMRLPKSCFRHMFRSIVTWAREKRVRAANVREEGVALGYSNVLHSRVKYLTLAGPLGPKAKIYE